MTADRLSLGRRLWVCLRTRWIPQLGRAGEITARAYLQQSRQHIVACNVRSRSGEIDIIMVTPDNQLVGVEVKTTLGKEEAAWSRIDAPKERRFTCTAQDFLLAHGLSGRSFARFDAVIVLGDPRRLRGKLRIHWFQNAF